MIIWFIFISNENSDPSIYLRKDLHFFEKDFHCKLVSIYHLKRFMVTQYL